VAAERLASITMSNRLWRYATRVTVTAALRFSPPDSPLPLQAIDTFLTGFGNDAGLWAAVLHSHSATQPWYPTALGILIREAVGYSHDRTPWAALERLTGCEA